MLTDALTFEMTKKERMTQIWISFDAYRKLLTVRGVLQRLDGKPRTLDDVIKELIVFWKERFESAKLVS